MSEQNIPQVDYRLLLEKYIEHVSQCEGIDFIDSVNVGMGSDVVFTDSELTSLTELRNEYRISAIK